MALAYAASIGSVAAAMAAIGARQSNGIIYIDVGEPVVPLLFGLLFSRVWYAHRLVTRLIAIGFSLYYAVGLVSLLSPDYDCSFIVPKLCLTSTRTYQMGAIAIGLFLVAHLLFWRQSRNSRTSRTIARSDSTLEPGVRPVETRIDQ